MAGAECPNNNNNNNNNNNSNTNNNNNSNTSGFVAAVTSIPVRFDASLRVGDDLIVFGIGAVNGVQFVVPSANPTSGTDFDGSVSYRSTGFEVVGKKIALLFDTFALAIYDTAADDTDVFDLTNIRASNIPFEDDEQGPLHGDGDLLVVCNDPTEVDDQINLKVVDLSQSPPTFFNLANAPGIDGNSSAQISTARINAAAELVVGERNDIFYIWDLNNPSDLPTEFDLTSDGGVADAPYSFDGEHILYSDDTSDHGMKLLNVSTGGVTSLTLNPSAEGSAAELRGDQFLYFLARDAFDSFGDVRRSAIGVKPGPDGVEGGVDGADPRDSDPEYVGYGSGGAIVPDGSALFIAG
ncbi:MAG TPA: hypothetical protein VNT79_09725, partial [Phycisphaerae bacterium]|nr:hypothetical protein [Phycisphaerae bacterium]